MLQQQRSAAQYMAAELLSSAMTNDMAAVTYGMQLPGGAASMQAVWATRSGQASKRMLGLPFDVWMAAIQCCLLALRPSTYRLGGGKGDATAAPRPAHNAFPIYVVCARDPAWRGASPLGVTGLGTVARQCSRWTQALGDVFVVVVEALLGAGCAGREAVPALLNYTTLGRFCVGLLQCKRAPTEGDLGVCNAHLAVRCHCGRWHLPQPCARHWLRGGEELRAVPSHF